MLAFDEIWGIFSVPPWNSTRLPIICHLSSKCPNFRLRSLSSLTFRSAILFSRDEEKQDDHAAKASFFIFIVLVWVLPYKMSITQHSKELLPSTSALVVCSTVCFLLLGYSGGCVAMRGGSHPGRWEVKDCRHFKAMSLCKQPVENREKTKQEEGWPFHPCYLDWESEPGLASCFKVMWKLHGHSQWNQHYFNFVRVSWMPLFQNSAWQTADN